MVAEAIEHAGLLTSDIDWLLLHQANIRIMEHAAEVPLIINKYTKFYYFALYPEISFYTAWCRAVLCCVVVFVFRLTLFMAFLPSQY